MDKNKVTEKLVHAITEVQKMSGRSSEGINFATKPIGGIEGFDSMNGVEAAVILSESLGYDLPAETLFVSKKGKRALSIAEISADISRIIKEEKDKK